MAVNPQTFADGFEERMQCLMDQYRNMDPVCSPAVCNKDVNTFNEKYQSVVRKKSGTQNVFQGHHLFKAE